MFEREDIEMEELDESEELELMEEIGDVDRANAEEIEAYIIQALSKSTKVFSELYDYMEEHSEDYDDDIEEFAFRAAVRVGNFEYVNEHIDDIELNDCGDCSTYLDETEDESMQDLLMSHGAYRSWDFYGDFKFAMETVNGSLLAFDMDFQYDVYEKYKETFGFTDAMISAALESGETELGDRDVESDMETLGVSFNNGEPSFEDMCGEDGMELMDLLEELEYDVSFEGESWKFETLGVYFIE